MEKAIMLREMEMREEGVSLKEKIENYFYEDLKFSQISLEESKVSIDVKYVDMIRKFEDNGYNIVFDHTGIRALRGSLNTLLISTGCLLVVE